MSLTVGALKFCSAIAAALLAAGSPVQAGAQGLPPIYEMTATALTPTTVVSEFPKGSFIENIALDDNGTAFVTSYLEGKVYRIDGNGTRSVWTAIDGTLAGIALNPDGSAVLSGWIKGKEAAVFWVSAAGRSEVLTKLEGGLFPNGVLRLTSERFLVADSYKGAIWEVNTSTRTARVWVSDELLARGTVDNPTPAVNGIKRFGAAIYASNTAKQLLIRIPVVDGNAGKPEVLRKDLGIDDFDFGPDGSLYGATHVYNSLVRVTPDGAITVLAGLAQGMAGSTAVAARNSRAGVTLFVTTNGGMSLPPEGGVQPGKVLRLEVPGLP